MNGVVFLWIFVREQSFVIDEDETFFPFLPVFRALVDQALIEDTISM